MTYRGGSNNTGTLFSYNVATNSFTKLLDFDGANGANPTGSLILASDGKLYGMTEFGGIYNGGVLFSFDPATNDYIQQFNFDSFNGAYPFGSLIQASDGKFYGMTTSGGSNDVGVIFSFDPSTSTFNKQVDLFYTTGSEGTGSLVQASDGKLYGMTFSGGANSFGVIFSFDPATNEYTRLFDFDGANSGSNPYGKLIQATDGKLYGMTYTGGSKDYGVLFSFELATSTYSKLLDFDGTNNGKNPAGSLVQASNGLLYGMTLRGGSNDVGVAFSFNPATTAFVKLADFNGTIGSYPYFTSFIEPTPQLTISDVSVAEGNKGSKNVKFKVTLSLPTTKTVTVTYKTGDGTATQPSDYAKKTAVLTFKSGLRTRYATIRIKGDKQIEDYETLQVMLSNATNAILYDSMAIGTIVNDDVIALTKATAKQSNSETNISVTAINVFPNPASNIVQVQLNGFSGKVMLQLADLNGSVLKQMTLQSTNTKLLQHRFPVADLANGTYLLVARDEKGHKQTVKVVVLH